MRRADQIAGAGLLLLGVAFSGMALWKYTYWGPTGPGSGFLPFWLGLAMAVLAAGLVLGTRRAGRPGARWLPVGAGLRRAGGSARRDRRIGGRPEDRGDGGGYRAVPRRDPPLCRAHALAVHPRHRRRRPPPSTTSSSPTGCGCPSPGRAGLLMDFFANLSLGFSIAFTPFNLLMAVAGVTLGTLIGALPGVGPVSGVALLLPLTFGMDPVSGIIMLAALYAGSMYGGTITSVLINTPGRVRLGGHLHRRLPDGAAGARGAGPRRRRHRLLRRRHRRRRAADVDVAAARALGAVVRPARDLRPHAVGPHHGDRAHRRQRAQGLHEHGVRADARHDGVRHHLGRRALRLRHQRAAGRGGVPARGHRALRAGGGAGRRGAGHRHADPEEPDTESAT